MALSGLQFPYISPVYVPQTYGTLPRYGRVSISSTVLSGASVVRGLSFSTSRIGWATTGAIDQLIFRGNNLLQNYTNRIIGNVQWRVYRTLSQYVDASILDLAINMVAYGRVPDWTLIAGVLESTLLKKLGDNELISQMYKTIAEVEGIVAIITNVESLILNFANDFVFSLVDSLLGGLFGLLEDGLDQVLDAVGLDNTDPIDIGGFVKDTIGTHAEEKPPEKQVDEKLKQVRPTEPSLPPKKSAPPEPFVVPTSGSTGASDPYVLPASANLGSTPIAIDPKQAPARVPDYYSGVDTTSSTVLDAAWRNKTATDKTMRDMGVVGESKKMLLTGPTLASLNIEAAASLNPALKKTFGEDYGLGNQGRSAIGFQKLLPVGSSFSEEDWNDDPRSWNMGLNNTTWKSDEKVRGAASLVYYTHIQNKINDIIAEEEDVSQEAGWIFVAWKYGPEITRAIRKEYIGVRPMSETLRSKVKDWRKYFDAGVSWSKDIKSDDEQALEEATNRAKAAEKELNDKMKTYNEQFK